MSNRFYLKQPGFFLIELLASLVFMGMLWMVIAQYQGTIAKITFNIQQRMKAINLANSLLDQVLIQRKIPRSQDYAGFEIQWNKVRAPSIKLSDINIIHPTDFYLVRVQVSWGTAIKHQINLTTGMQLQQENV